jgi:site-specific recombinase XerD
MKLKKKRKLARPKTKLGLPDLEQAKAAVVGSLPSPGSKREYGRSIDEFVAWYCSEPRLSFNKTVVMRFRMHLEERHLAPATINLHLAAVRRLAYEASDSGLLSPELAAGIRRVKGAKKLGVRLGNWLTRDEARALWQLPDARTLRGARDRAMLALLLGCGLRRRELTDLELVDIERREDHWAIVDLVGKGGHVRTVPIPDWVKLQIDEWCKLADVSVGKIFRCVCRAGKTWGKHISEQTVWHVVKTYAAQLGLGRIAPHDLRRSCARLCHAAGGELEQIQFLLGHASVQTTERYLGCKQRLRGAVNDQIGIEPSS